MANASLSEAVGPALADCHEVLTAVRGVLAAKHASNSEELVLGALLTLNNLSFYPSAANSALAAQQLVFAQGDILLHVRATSPWVLTGTCLIVAALVPLLEPSHPAEARVEALRVFGNLTRWQETRDYLADHQGK